MGAAAIYLWCSAIYRAGPTERTDLPVYLAGAGEVLLGRDPFGAISGRGWPYIYPPTLATLLIPLTPLPQRAAAGVWYLFSLGCLLLGLRALRRALATPGPFLGRELVPLALIALPASSALLRGQVSPLLLGLLGLAWLELEREHELRAGVLVALAAAIKLTPGLVLLGFAADRRWRACVGFALGAFLWLVLVPLPWLGLSGTHAALRDYVPRVILPAAQRPEDPHLGLQPNLHIGTNQSLTSQALRRLPPAASRPLCALGGGLLLAWTLVLCARRRLDLVAWAWLLGLPLLVAPVAWHHYHVLLFPALLLLARAERRRSLALFALLSLIHFVWRPARDLGLLGWGTLWVLIACSCLPLEEGRVAQVRPGNSAPDSAPLGEERTGPSLTTPSETQ